MKRITLVLFTIILALGLAACGNDSGDSKSTSSKKQVGKPDENVATAEEQNESSELSDKVEVEVYFDEAKESYLGVTSLGERWDELREASASGQIDDYEFRDILYEEILPLNMELLEELEAIQTPNEETTDINETIIEAIGNQHLAFTEIIFAIETGDLSKITSANELLNDVRKKDREFVRKLEALLLKYNIDYE